MIGVLSEHSHAVVSKHSKYAASDKMRMDRCEIATEDVNPVFRLERRRLFPDCVTPDSATDLSHDDPVCPAAKRRPRPLTIDILGRPRRHLRIGVVSAKMILKG